MKMNILRPVRLLFAAAALLAAGTPLALAASPDDPGPTLTVPTGAVEPTVAAPLDLTATARHVERGHVYIAAELPAGVVRAPQRMRVDIQGDRAGVAVIAAGTPATLLVRLVGGRLPQTLSLRVVSRAQFRRGGSVGDVVEQPLRLLGIARAPKVRDTRARFWRGFAAWIERRGTLRWALRAPFHSFAAGRARLLAEGPDAAATGPTRPRRARRSELGEMMSLYTGVTSVEEALQADRGLALREDPSAQRTVPLADIEGVPLAQHPWDDMIRVLGKPVVMEPLASRVPADMAYLHFHDLRTAVKAASDLDEWITPLAQLFEWRSGSSHLSDRYQTMLMIERTGLARTLGHVAAKGVALVVGDPFLREGSDVGLLFDLRRGPLLYAALASYQAKAAERHPDLTEAQWTLDGHTVRRVFTPDRTVDQHRVEVDGVLMLTNSRRGMERLLAAHAGRVPRLSESGDFRYLRAVYPFSADAEDGYAFISDAFVARATSPRTRILQARRMGAQADLYAVGYAALLHGWLEGTPPRDARDLERSGLLRAAELRHADGGAIHFQPALGARSERWGRPAAMTPLAELDIERVTPAERDAYVRFRTGYQRYWRAFIDPIAVRLIRSDDGRRIRVDARMLPLIEATDYDEIARLVGRGRVLPPRLSGAAQWTLAIGQNARLRRELDALRRVMGLDELQFGWVGDWAMVGAANGSALWDAAIALHRVPTTRAERLRLGDQQQLAILDRLPVYAGVHVRNPFALVATLTALRSFVQQAAPDMVEWHNGARHRDVQIVDIEVDIRRARRGRRAVRFSFHYAVCADVLLASPDLATLQFAIDAVLDETAPDIAEVADGGATQSHLGVAPGPPGSWLRRVLMALVEVEALRQQEAAFRDLEVLVRGLGRLPEPEERRRIALGYLGFEPATVQGGTFSLRGGQLHHSIYGSESQPIAPEIPVAEGRLTGLLSSLESLGLGVEIEGEGRTRGLRVLVDWRRR